MSTQRAEPADTRMSFLDAANLTDIHPDLVGVKAANLMRMAAAGLDVPPGFVLSADVCADYYASGGHLHQDVAVLVARGVAHIEQATGLHFGARRRPLLVSVRSGAAVSMPGMLDTILDVGLCDDTLPGLLRSTGDPVFVWDSYRRLVASYAEVVEGCPAAAFAVVTDDALHRHGVPAASELDVAAQREIVGHLQDIYQSLANRPFPQDPMQQLLGAVEAVLRSWNSHRAVEYRRLEGLTSLAGTAVTVQAMVFGNLGVTSGSGVGFTRDPATGEDRLYIDFLLNSQGEDVVGGRHDVRDPDPLIAAIPGLAHKLQTVRRTLEAVFGDAQDFEFTVEDGNLWLLQTRAAKRTPWAALHIACALVDEGLIDQSTALERLRPYDLERVTRFTLAPNSDTKSIGEAVPASTGVASGRIALDVETALHYGHQGDPVTLVREEASTEDIAALALCCGLLTARGARTSHAAVVARQLAIVCLVNCLDLVIDLRTRSLRIGGSQLREGDTITIDGANGRIYVGALELVKERPAELINRVGAWQRGLPA